MEQELLNAETAKGLSFGDDFNVEVFKRVLTAYLPELTADGFDKLVESYRQQQAEEKLDIIHEGMNNGEEGSEGAAPNNQTPRE